MGKLAKKLNVRIRKADDEQAGGDDDTRASRTETGSGRDHHRADDRGSQGHSDDDIDESGEDREDDTQKGEEENLKENEWGEEEEYDGAHEASDEGLSGA